MTITSKFSELKSRGEKALVVFFTAGDQPLSELPAIIKCLAENGADVIEVGIPFSDPFGEGPTIQASSQRALDNGVTPEQIFSALSLMECDIPVVTMGYYNPVLRMGLDSYASRSAEVGCTGTIISDLVADEGDDWDAASLRAGIETIYLIAPTSTEARIDEVCARTTGFVYAVSRTGVTGAESVVPPEVGDLVGRIRARTDKPVCVGFGISSPEHVRLVCETADGAVVGSALVKLLHESWGKPGGSEKVAIFVRELKSATRV
jgi:tryptophan synthase alpha chain